MNVFQGIIQKVISEGQLSLIHIEVGDVTLSSIVVDTPATAPYLSVGNAIQVVCKETEVVIALPGTFAISLRNQIAGTVAHIDSGKLLSRVQAATSIGKFNAIITTNACKSLALTKGKEIVLLIKTNEMMLSQDA